MKTSEYKSTFLGRLGNWLSQGGHVLSNGSPDVSISAKADYMTSRGSEYWKFLKSVIDWAFLPKDGANHTGQAFESDENEDYEIGVGMYQNIACTVFIFIFCPIVAIFTYPTSWIVSIKD